MTLYGAGLVDAPADLRRFYGGLQGTLGAAGVDGV